MWGVTWRSTPARRTAWVMRFQSVTGAKADPRLVRNTTPGLFGRTKVCRTAKYRCNAVTAAAPTGTTRSLFPLPITIRNPASR